MESLRFCPKIGHDTFKLEILCCKPNCNQQRLLCAKCLPIHGEHSQFYIMIDELQGGQQTKIENWPIDSGGKKLREMVINFQVHNFDQIVDSHANELKKKFKKELDTVKKDIKDQISKEDSSSKKQQVLNQIRLGFDDIFSSKKLLNTVNEYLESQFDEDDLIKKLDQSVALEQEKKEKLTDLKKQSSQLSKFQNFSEKDFMIISENFFKSISSLKQSIKKQSTSWQFIPSTYQANSIVMVDDSGLHFKGNGTSNLQFVYSDQGWDSGVHGYTIEIEPATTNFGSCYISIVNDDMKNRISNTGSYPYHCLFSSSNGRINRTRGSNFITTANQGGRVNVVMDFDNNQMWIEDQRETTRCQLQSSFNIRGKLRKIDILLKQLFLILLMNFKGIQFCFTIHFYNSRVGMRIVDSY